MLLCSGSGRRGAVWTRRSKVRELTLVQLYGLQLKLESKEYAGQADQQLVGGLMAAVLARFAALSVAGLGKSFLSGPDVLKVAWPMSREPVFGLCIPNEQRDIDVLFENG